MTSTAITIDILESKKRKALIGALVFFTLWQLGQMVMFNFSNFLSSRLEGIFTLMTVIGSLGWAAVAIYYVKLAKLFKKHPDMCRQLNDERNTIVAYKAMAHGLKITGGVAALIFVFTFLLDNFYSGSFNLSGMFVSHFIMVLAITSSWMAYLIVDKDE